MNIYNVSKLSSCGSYFAAYLQTVQVIADDEKEALELVIAWLKENRESFITSDPLTWDVQNLGEVKKGVFDSVYDSDY